LLAQLVTTTSTLKLNCGLRFLFTSKKVDEVSGSGSVTLRWSGATCFAAVLVILWTTFVPTAPARADCVQGGTTVTCSGSAPGGFGTGTENNLTVNIQPGATVGPGAGVNINDNNRVNNGGTVSLGDFTAGITVNNNSSVSNSGTVVVGEDSAGIVSTGNFTSIVNNGTIRFGGCSTGVDAGGHHQTVVNNGLIDGSGCLSTTGIFVGDDSTVTNSGTIRTGEVGAGIVVGRTATATNTGTIIAGLSGVGMVGDRDSTLINRGTIIVGDASGSTGGGLLGLGRNITFLNSGTIVVGSGAFGPIAGIFGAGNNNRATNTGTITGADQAAGIAVFDFGSGSANPVISNSGQITMGFGGVGIVTDGNGAMITNSGIITVGSEGGGIVAQGNNNVIANTGTISVGACGVGINTSTGSGSTISNSGVITGSGCLAVGIAMGDVDTLTNSGRISATFSVTSSGTAVVTNSGTLDGVIQLGGPNSSLTNSGLITIGGPLAAGEAVGHEIDGTFTQTRPGTLALRVLSNSSTGNYDTLSVTGAANLGGTLRPVAQPGLYGPTTTYLGVLTFAGSTGRFDTVAPASVFLAASAVYNAGSVDLMLTRLPFNSVGGGSANTRAIGNVLEANYSTGLTGTLASFYSQLLVSTTPNILSQLTGEIATAAPSASFAVFGQFLGTIFSQTSSTRTGGQAASNGGSQTALRRTTTTGGGTRLALAATEECASDTCDSAAAARRFTYWAQGFGGAASIDGNGNVGSARVDINTGGGATGIDLQVTPSLLLGVTMGTASAGFSVGDLLSYGSARAIVLGLYGGYNQGPLYVDGALAYGYDTFTTTRLIGTGTVGEMAYGAFDGHQYGGRVEGGWRFGIEQHQLTPFAGLAVQALTQAGYSETTRNTSTGAPGMLGVTVQGQTSTSVRSTLGLQFETALRATDDAVFKPRLRLGWAHEFNANRSTSVALSVLPGAPFQVIGAQPATDALIVGAGFELELGRMVRLFGQFDGDFAQNARAFSGTGGVRLIW
jgi:outer membrane autotransporter protein